MNWLERYVQGVKRYLPKKNRDDIGDELMSVLGDKLEADKDRPLKDIGEAEVKDWVAGQEHPMITAASYQTYPEIVAREFYPPYFLTLKVVIGILIGIQIFTMGLSVLLGRVDVFSAVAGLLGGVLVNLLWGVGSVTLVFHIIGRQTSAKKLLKKWSVKDLPGTSGKWEQVAIGEKIFEVAIFVLMLVIINGYWPESWTENISDLVYLNPATHRLIPWFNALLLLEITQNLWVIARPRWTKLKLAANLALSGLGLGFLAMVLGIDPLVIISPDIVPEDPEFKIKNWADRSLNVVIYIIGAIILSEIGRDIYRIVKLKK